MKTIKRIIKTIKPGDFVPPIVKRIIGKLTKVINQAPIHPFDCIPQNISPNWFLDIGANVGDVTAAALKTYPQCKAICFEPVLTTYNSLEKNLEIFNGRYFLYNKALSDTNGEGEINITSFHGTNSILPQSKLHKESSGVRELQKQKIQLVRLDDISRTLPAEKIDVMKIDVEGFEFNVLKGGNEFLRNCVDIVIIELSPYRFDDVRNNYVLDVFTFMRDAGFILINIYDIEHISNHTNLLLGHMDCVFRHQSKL